MSPVLVTKQMLQQMRTVWKLK